MPAPPDQNPATPAARLGGPTYDGSDANPAAQRSRQRRDRNEERQGRTDASPDVPARTQNYGDTNPDDTATVPSQRR